MTAITVRKLPEDAKQRLRMRAAANGRSMEAEARDILLSALELPRADVGWLEVFLEYGEKYDELPVVHMRGEARAVDFARERG